MILTYWVPVAVSILVLVVTALFYLSSRRTPHSAPQVPGLPIIGNALGLGRHGVAYLSKCRQKFGDAFTLSLAGPKMTFLFEPSHIDYFFSAPDEKITFRPAVEQFTQRVFGLTSRLFFPLHFKMLTELRHLLVPAALSAHMQALGTRALELLPCYVHHSQVDLYTLCRGLVFQCAVEALFGRPFVASLPELLLGQFKDPAQGPTTDGPGAEQEEGEGGTGEAGVSAISALALGLADEAERGRRALPRPPAGVQRLARTFYSFEEGFELAASPVPHALQQDFVAARTELLGLLTAADQRGLFQGTPAGQLLERTSGLPPHLRSNLLLALLWASQANTIPAIFWSTAFLLLPENQVHKAAVVAELQAELQSASAGQQPESEAVDSIAADGVAAAASSPAAGRPPGAPADPPSEPSTSALVAAAARLAASRRSAVSRCVAEALRLRVQSIDVRQAAAPLDLPSTSAPGGRLKLPRGRLLAVCPFESHHDPKLFGAGGSGDADPWAFDPNRPELKLGEGTAVVLSMAGMAFGGGPYRCPGRFFAEQELGLLVQLLLWTYDMQLSYGDGASRSVGCAGASGEPAAQAFSAVPPQPQLQEVQGGSLLYGVLALLVGPAALSWGCGWFDGLDGHLQDWRCSGDPAGLLPPCDLRRLVGTKIPKKPCWVQLSLPTRALSMGADAL